MNFVKFLRTPFFIEHLCWLLLEIVVSMLPGCVFLVVYVDKMLSIRNFDLGLIQGGHFMCGIKAFEYIESRN